jgi:hypothetical protein
MFALGRDPTKFADSNKVETPRTPIIMRIEKGLRTSKVCCYTFIPYRNEDPFFPAESEGQSPSSSQPSLHAPGGEAIEGGVRLRTLWLRPQGSVLVEEALAEIPPGRDGSGRQAQDPLPGLTLCGHRESVGHDAPITSSCPNGLCIPLQKLDGI